MRKLKALLASVGTTMVVAFASMGAAAADAAVTNNCPNTAGSGGTNCAASATDNSTTLTVSGNCSGIFQLDNTQANVLLGQANGNLASGNVIGGGGSTNSSSSTNTQSTTQGNANAFTFSPNCSVTNVAAASSDGGRGAGAPAAAQVAAPGKGAVHAGAGGGLAQASGVTSLVGLAGSISAVGAGLSLRKRAVLDF